MKGYEWSPKNEYANEHRLIAPDGQIVAWIKYLNWDSEWVWGVKHYISLAAAKAVAEKGCIP